MEAPLLDGIHHVKIPVTDLARSRDWYASRLGYAVDVEFEEGGALVGLVLTHPRGGPRIALRRDPEHSAGLGDFDFLAIGVPTRSALEDLARHLTGLGDAHAGVHGATAGWILPLLHDPDGHEVRFYTTEHHTEPTPGGPLRVADPRESAERRERELEGRGRAPGAAAG